MKRFTVTFLFMLVLFLAGILVGINQASLGMIQIRGYSDQSFQEAIQTTEADDGTVEVEVMGQSFQQVQLDEKKQQFDETYETQGIQKLALSLGNFVKGVYNLVLSLVYQLVQLIF
ncbi:hypothetical protein N781_11100 [Pontibacillus halophilus JSM 076056 = DSM 19796]|uniref:DUF3679 domain-containing protein n=2 Tax=Pontibacillus TaxID=289201 RepID=A0A0A5GNU4_9BACI|nr:hypothetical protein N781_11100 [Pontibacillus halophilus JSM 076056 = DSM 19796]